MVKYSYFKVAEMIRAISMLGDYQQNSRYIEIDTFEWKKLLSSRKAFSSKHDTNTRDL